jgi:pilus assembly protein Flp/PilA
MAELPGRDGQSGQGLVEYALILILVAMVVIVILTLLGGTLSNVFSDVASKIH